MKCLCLMALSEYHRVLWPDQSLSVLIKTFLEVLLREIAPNQGFPVGVKEW